MHWHAQDFYQNITIPYKLRLVGWPEGVAFDNLSKLKRSSRVLDDLLRRWVRGELCFVQMSDAELQELGEIGTAPGISPPRKQRMGRCDIKKDRNRPVTNPLNLPRRRVRNGPKTPKIVPDNADDSEIEEEPEVPVYYVCGKHSGEESSHDRVETSAKFSRNKYGELDEDPIQNADDAEWV